MNATTARLIVALPILLMGLASCAGPDATGAYDRYVETPSRSENVEVVLEVDGDEDNVEVLELVEVD